MEIGLGIFLGLVFVGLIYLYVSTREQWDWRKIFKRSALIFGGLLALLILLIGGLIAKATWWDHRPQLMTQLGEISIGEKMSDVFFKHGDFKELIDPDYNDRGVRNYTNTEKHISITVNDGTVRTIHYLCQETDYKSVNGIACGDSGEMIKEKFGSGVRILCRKVEKQGKFAGIKDPFSRTYDVIDYGTRYYLAMNKVVAIMIASQKDLQSFVGINWDKCE